MLYIHVWATSCLLISIKCSADIKGTDRIKTKSSENWAAFWSLLCVRIIVRASFFSSKVIVNILKMRRIMRKAAKDT